MVDDDDEPTTPSSHENHEDDLPFDPYDELDIMNLMSDFNPTLVNFVFNNTIKTPPPLPPPPPPTPSSSSPLPLTLAFPPIPEDTNTECNESQTLEEPSHEIGNDDNEPFEFTWDMVLQLDDKGDNNIVDRYLNDNIISADGHGMLEEIGDDINVVGSLRLEGTNPVFGGNNGSNFETGGPSTMSVPVVTPIIFDGVLVCDCCRLLRTIFHCNGRESMRLDIYGGDDYFCHGILEIQQFVEGISEHQHQTFHFKGLSYEDVERFVQDYLSQREATRLPLAEDSNPSLFQAMSNLSLEPRPPSIPMSLARPDESLNVPPVPLHVSLSEKTPEKPKKKQRRQTALAAQRARTKLLTLKDLAPYFCIPIEEAARRLNICPTVAKKISRKGGLSRWPHRKIRSWQRRVSTAESTLRHARDPIVRANAERERDRYQKLISDFCANILKQYPP